MNKTYNKLYRKNEKVLRKAILELYYDDPGRIKAKPIMKKTGLSRQTIYKHYPELSGALFLIEQKLLEEYDVWLEKQIIALEKIISDKNQRLFFILMLFMAKNSECFYAIACSYNWSTIHKMMKKIYPELEIKQTMQDTLQTNIYEDDSKENAWISGCIDVICQWISATKCEMEQANEYIRKLMKITSEV